MNNIHLPLSVIKKWRNFNICPNYMLLITLFGIFHNDATLIPVFTCLCKHNELEGFNENLIYRGPRQSLSFVCQSIIFQALNFWIFSGGNFVVEFPFCVKLRPSFLIFLVFIPLGCGNYFLVFTFSNVVRLQVPPENVFYPRLDIIFEISNLPNG